MRARLTFCQPTSPNPCDPHCPAEFKEAARATLQELLGVREGDEMRRALITRGKPTLDIEPRFKPR